MHFMSRSGAVQNVSESCQWPVGRTLRAYALNCETMPPYQASLRLGMTCRKLLVAWQLVAPCECLGNYILSSMLVLLAKPGLSIYGIWRVPGGTSLFAVLGGQLAYAAPAAASRPQLSRANGSVAWPTDTNFDCLRQNKVNI